VQKMVVGRLAAILPAVGHLVFRPAISPLQMPIVRGEGGLRVPTFDPHTINACWFLFLSFAYLLVAEAASFDKKELCRSDTDRIKIIFDAKRTHSIVKKLFSKQSKHVHH
jgi:hypothetical protein